MPPKQAKKKKGISLTPEKKKLLKQLIMQKAAEELKKQQEQEAAEKKKIIDSRVPQLALDGLDKDKLQGKVKELYSAICRLEEEKYDWETRLNRQTEEISELNIRVNDVKGKFSKPMLKKVAKASSKIAQVPKKKLISANLKSTGPKFAVEESEEKAKPEWKAEKPKKEEKEEKSEEEDDEEEEEEEEE